MKTLSADDVPVPDHVAGAGQRQRAALDVGDDAVGDAAGEGVLHHREADQHDDEHEPAEQRRRDDVVGEIAETVSAAPNTQTTSSSQVGISITARS